MPELSELRLEFVTLSNVHLVISFLSLTFLLCMSVSLPLLRLCRRRSLLPPSIALVYIFPASNLPRFVPTD